MTTTIDLANSQPTLNELLAITAAGNDVALVNGGKLVATLRPATCSAPQTDIKPTRTPGKQPNAFTFVSDDFDAPLPDAFWLSKEP